MARIVLDPGESFVHSHPVESTSTIVRGSVQLEYSNTRKVVAVGTTVEIPRDTPHCLTNVGHEAAEVLCSHIEPPPLSM